LLPYHECLVVNYSWLDDFFSFEDTPGDGVNIIILNIL